MKLSQVIAALLLAPVAGIGAPAINTDSKTSTTTKKESDKRCLVSDRFEHATPRACTRNFQALADMPAKLQKLTRKHVHQDVVENSQQQRELAQFVDIDTGAQCAMGKVLRDAAGQLDQSLSDIRAEKQRLEKMREAIFEFRRKPRQALLELHRKAEAYVSCIHLRGGAAAAAAHVADCQRVMSVSQAQLNQWELGTGKRVSQLVAKDPKARSVLNDQFNEAEKLLEEINENQRKLYAEQARLEKEFKELNTKRMAISDKYSCGDKPNAMDPLLVSKDANKPGGVAVEAGTGKLSSVDENLRDSTFSVANERGDRATSFRAVTTGPDGKPIYHDVTNVHVVAEDFENQKTLNLLDTEVSPAGPKAGLGDAQRYEIAEGKYDRLNDVVIRQNEIAGPALPVVKDGATPELDQQFVAAGHPGAKYNGAYVNMSCTFQGYEASSGYYVMNCPTGGSFVGGMSGGPVVDRNTGQVWGVVAEHQQLQTMPNGQPKYRDEIFVSPIQQNSTGQILTGQQRSFTYSHCYDAKTSRYIECTVMPRHMNEF